jgi:hypothetical protein
MIDRTPRCTGTTRAGARCTKDAVLHFTERTHRPDPERCALHLEGEDRAAWKHAQSPAGYAEHMAALALTLPPEQQAKIAAHEQAAYRVWVEGIPACWDWPTDTPVDARGGLSDATWKALGEYGRALSLVDTWQDGRCAVCGDRGSLKEDHDHATGLTRGYLCNSCNTKEGAAYRDYLVFTRYRERHPAAILGVRAEYTFMDRLEAQQAYLEQDARERATSTDHPLRGVL